MRKVAAVVVAFFVLWACSGADSKDLFPSSGDGGSSGSSTPTGPSGSSTSGGSSASGGSSTSSTSSGSSGSSTSGGPGGSDGGVGPGLACDVSDPANAAFYFYEASQTTNVVMCNAGGGCTSKTDCCYDLLKLCVHLR
jgi:hypothetical protein